MKTCENCGNEHKGEYGSGRFCTSKCSRGYSTKDKRLIINAKVKQTFLDKRITKVKKCISCYAEIEKIGRSKYCKTCKMFLQYKKLFLKLGINETNILLANKKAFNKLFYEYNTNKKSTVDLKKEYGIQTNTIFFFFEKNGIKLRSVRDSILLGYLDGSRNVIMTINTPYKKGIHKTWDGKEVFFRSSYELNYCKELDSKKIVYEMEKVRIAYYDSQQKKERVAVPDFFLPLENTLVEIKSAYTLDENNMNDKILAYVKEGYHVKLIVDGNEVLIK